jgi:hypothetical protein
MRNGTFTKVDKSEEKMYGPRQLIVCGYTSGQQPIFLALLNQIDMADLPVKFITDADSHRTLKDVLAMKEKRGEDKPSSLSQAIIMCGLTHKELHRLMGVYRGSGFPKQLWATLTPVSENWTVKDLLEELGKESGAMRQRNSSPNH